MKALVLGASGLLGTYAGYALAHQGWNVTGVSRAPLGFYPHSQLIDSLSDVPRVLRSAQWDVVINCVAMANHEDCEARPADARAINADLPALWAGIAASTAATFVHVSTDAVFDGAQEQPYVEDDVTSAPSVYGKTKRIGEELVVQANPNSLVFRTNFFGWSRDSGKGILDFFVSGFEQKKPMTGFTDYVASSLSMADLFDLLVEALAKNATGLYHLTSSTPLSKYDFGKAVGEALEGGVGLLSAGLLSDNAALGNRGHNLGLSVAKLETLVGHPIPGTLSGIARAVKERHAVMDYFGHTHRDGKTGQ
jgi:dTDP-4-dehydrorhamnose reductase